MYSSIIFMIWLAELIKNEKQSNQVQAQVVMHTIKEILNNSKAEGFNTIENAQRTMERQHFKRKEEESLLQWFENTIIGFIVSVTHGALSAFNLKLSLITIVNKHERERKNQRQIFVSGKNTVAIQKTHKQMQRLSSEINVLEVEINGEEDIHINPSGATPRFFIYQLRSKVSSRFGIGSCAHENCRKHPRPVIISRCVAGSVHFFLQEFSVMFHSNCTNCNF